MKVHVRRILVTKYINILEIPSDTGYWLLRANGGKYYDDFFLNNFIAISDNEITLKLIEEAENRSFAGITNDHYKELYTNQYPDWSNQQIAHAVGRTQKFVEEMKIGDLVLVPSRRSTTFLLGVINSEVYEITDKETTVGANVQYAISPYLKRRKVFWIKEIPREQISEKLYWILSAHQTIFDLKEHKEYINQLLSPIYIQNGLCHGTMKISKKEGLNSDEWYELYSIIKKYSDQTSDEVVIKSNVQSPGLIEFVVSNPVTTLTLMMVLTAPIVADIDYKGIKMKGIIPFFISLRKENMEHKKTQKELELIDLDKRAKEIEIKRAEFELKKDKEIYEQTKKETEVIRLRNQLRISSFDAGKTVVTETKMDNSVSPDED